jgi:hypothetical protein
MGVSALQDNTTGFWNTAIGDFALWQLGNTSGTGGGSNNIALGNEAGFNYLGNESSNIVIGSDTGAQGVAGENYAIHIGGSDIASIDIGYDGPTDNANHVIHIGNNQTTAYIAGVINGNGGGLTNLVASTTGGSQNTAIGSWALADTSGTANTGMGYYALYNNTTANNNTANGFAALYNNTTGYNNTAIGYLALNDLGYIFGPLNQNGGGSGNIALGYEAGQNYLGNESSNIVIGSDNGALGVSGENYAIHIGGSEIASIDIGYDGPTDNANHVIHIGRHQNTTIIAGIYGASFPGGLPVVINAMGQLGTADGGGGGGSGVSSVVSGTPSDITASTSDSGAVTLNVSQNPTFSGTVTATSFSGAFNGNGTGGSFTGLNNGVAATSMASSGGVGVTGIASGTGGTGGYFTGPGDGVVATSTASSGGAGVTGASPATAGAGVIGSATGTSGGANGVYGQTSDTSGAGVYAQGASTSSPGLTIGQGTLRVSGAGVNSGTTAFIHLTTAQSVTQGGYQFSRESLDGHALYAIASMIVNPACDGNPNAILMVTFNGSVGTGDVQNVGPSYYPSNYEVWNHVVGAHYAQGNWYLVNEDATEMPVDIAFNVLVITP